jgi:Concanavalin A-like lectin/glucanases superfamily
MSITIRSAQTIHGGVKLRGNNTQYVDPELILWLDASNPASYPGSGTTWYDLSANHYNATLHNGASFSTDSINFDYTQSQYADIAPNSMFNGDFTAIGWVYVRSYQAWSRLFDFGNGSSQDNVLIAITNGSTGYPVFNVWVNGGNLQSSTQMPLNQWAQLAATQSGTTQTLYINGQQVAQQTGGPEANVTRNLNYISRSNWGGDAYLDGKISSLKILNRALSDAEITANYTSSNLITILANKQVSSGSYLLTNGNAFFLKTSYPEIATIPSAARITSNISGFGTRTVSYVSEYLDYYVVNYNGTGLSGYASLSDTYTFTWDNA